MAGEAILRSEIESNVAKYLDRVGDPVVMDVTGLWFTQAHRKAQRQFNFSIMEGTDLISPLIEGMEYYTVNPRLKEPTYAQIFDGSTIEVLRNYRKTDMNTVARYKLDGGYKEAVFAIEGRTYFLWPPTQQITPTMYFAVHGYMFGDTPALDQHDWLTDYGSDFLMYQSLLESVDYVSAPEGRVITWKAKADEAFNELIAMDTQFKFSGPMALR
jgi:hypothetical protein